MHTHVYRKNDRIRFHYNSDFSGDILVMAEDGGTIYIPAEAILEFVALCYVTPALISELEQMEPNQLLLRKGAYNGPDGNVQ